MSNLGYTGQNIALEVRYTEGRSDRAAELAVELVGLKVDLIVTGDTAPDRIREAAASDCLLMHKPVANSRLRAAIVNLALEAPASL